MNSKTISCVLSLLCLLLGSAAGQGMAVGLGSPNTRDSMSYEDAKASLHSFEERNFAAVADRIVCALAERGFVEKVIGEVHEPRILGVSGAENSVVVKAPVSFEAMRYAMALLGRFAHQKFVIAFVPQSEGAPQSTMVLLRIPKDISRERMERVLDDARVPYRTLLDSRRVLVFLPEGVSDTRIRNAARILRAHIYVQRGVGEIVGNDDRVKAAAEYDRIISEYESAHPGHALSPKLWSREWHDAESRTCTPAEP